MDGGSAAINMKTLSVQFAAMILGKHTVLDMVMGVITSARTAGQK